MDERNEVLIPNVTPEQMARLGEIIKAAGGTITGTETGLVENECFATKFAYDKNSQVLTLDPLRLVRTLTPRRLRRTVQQLIGPPPEPLFLADGTELPQPTPYDCATYNWAIGFFNNQSGSVLTFSNDGTVHGVIQSGLVSKVMPGDGFTTHKDGYWVNKEPKDSTLGVAGTLSWGLADGVTTLVINYANNTTGAYTATVALQGGNLARYVASIEAKDVWNDSKATTYLYLYVTLAKATSPIE